MIRKLLLFVFVAVSAATFAQRNCSSMEVLERLQKEDPFLQSRMAEIEAFTQNYTLVQTEAVAGVITIPVVVHVVYNGSTQNISAAQINSQIAVLNDDFRRKYVASFKAAIASLDSTWHAAGLLKDIIEKETLPRQAGIPCFKRPVLNNLHIGAIGILRFK